MDLTAVVPSSGSVSPTSNPAVYNPEAVNEPKKKKYAEEDWLGGSPHLPYLLDIFGHGESLGWQEVGGAMGENLSICAVSFFRTHPETLSQ